MAVNVAFAYKILTMIGATVIVQKVGVIAGGLLDLTDTGAKLSHIETTIRVDHATYLLMIMLPMMPQITWRYGWVCAAASTRTPQTALSSPSNLKQFGCVE